MAVEIKEEEWKELNETVKKLQEENKELMEMIIEDRQERGRDRQRIAILEWYLKLKEKNKRNDNDILCMDLYKELMDRPHRMITRDIKNKFNLNHTQQALRAMERVAGEFSLDIILHKGKGKNKGWWIKKRTSTGLI